MVNMTLVILNSTTVQVPAGTDNAQVGVGINGRWRYNSASVNGTLTSGAAGTYGLWATASDNSFTLGPPESDSTVYSFALQILPTGSSPSTALFRQIGSVVWSGTAITDAFLIDGYAHDAAAGTASLRTLGTGAQQAAAGTAPAAAVAAIPVDAVVGTGSLRTIGTGAQQAAPGTEAATRAAAVTAITTTVGVLASRPSIGSVPAGRVYYATDNGIAYVSDGSTWQRVDLDMLTRIGALEAKIPSGPTSFRVEQATSPVLAAGTTPLSFSQVTHALNSFSSATTGPSWTIPVTGLYHYDLDIWFVDPSSNAAFATGTAGNRQRLFLQRNGATVHAAVAYADSGGLFDVAFTLAAYMQFTAGDVITLVPAAVNLPGAKWGGHLGMTLVRV